MYEIKISLSGSLLKNLVSSFVFLETKKLNLRYAGLITALPFDCLEQIIGETWSQLIWLWVKVFLLC
jgi:hypothetical protein